MIKVKSLKIPNVKVICPTESVRYDEMITNQTVIWQWNVCRNAIDKNMKPIVMESEIFFERALTLRGMYYTIPPRTNSLFIRAISGSVFINVIDLRDFSRTYRTSVGCEISAENKQQIYIPENFGWGALSLADNTILLCKSTNYLDSKHTKLLNYADPWLSIYWPKKPQFISPIIESAPGIDDLETQIQLEIIREREMTEEMILSEEESFITTVEEHEKK